MAAPDVTSHTVEVKEVVPSGSIDLPDDFHGFAATVYEAKGYIVVTTGYGDQTSISVWDIEHHQKALVEASTQATINDRLSTSKDGKYLAQLLASEKKIAVWDLANGIKHKKLEMVGKAIQLSDEVHNCLCRTNKSETNRPWLFLLINYKVEVWAYDSNAKQMKRIRIISNDNVEIENITVLDFVSTKLQTEIIAMNWHGNKVQLRFFDTTGKLVKVKDVAELTKGQDLYGVTYDSTGKFVVTWAHMKAMLLDSKGLKTAPMKGEYIFCGWFAIGQKSFLLAWDGTAFHIVPFDGTKFEFDKGFSIAPSGTRPAIEGIVNTLVVGQDLLFFTKDYENTKKILLATLAF